MTFSSRIRLFCLFNFFSSISFIQAASHQDLQAFLNNWRQEQKITSAVVSVQDTHSGQVSSYTSGTTTLDSKVPVTIDTLYGVGSITKTFVAATCLQLQEEGKLKLDDPIGPYFPQYPRWKTITIRQLLNMTSGITNFTWLPAFAELEKEQSKKVIPPSQFIAMAYAVPDKFSPGTGWHYSNTNYYLAGLIIEKVAKKSLNDVFTQRFFHPLHLSHTFYSDTFYPESVIKKMAHAYSGKKDITAFNASFYGAAGAMVMNESDLRVWTKALLTPGIILKSASIEEMKKTIVPPPSPPKPRGFRYGLGVYSLDVPNIGTIWYYSGVLNGYTSCFVDIPSQHKIIVAQVATWPEGHMDVLFPGQPLLNEFLKKEKKKNDVFSAPPESILIETKYWIVNQCIDSALPGYLILSSKQNTTNLSELPPEALAEMGPLLASLQKAATDLLKPSYLYIGRYGHMKGCSFHFHIIPVYDWVVESFMKDKRYQTLKQFRYRTDTHFADRQFDAADLQLYIWREFCESKTPPAIVGPSVEEVMKRLKSHFSSKNHQQ